MFKEFFDENYYENGIQSDKSLYQNFRWIPELTIPLAHHIIQNIPISKHETVMDFGCAKGYLVQALRLLGVDAYGVDISNYAIDKATKETSEFVKLIKPFDEDFLFCDVLLCKDILEHIPYEFLDTQLNILRNKCTKIFAIIPLGLGGKYIIPAYELDKSHYIRESEKWWEAKFNSVGFLNIKVTTNLGPFKSAWQNVDPKGNVLIVGT